MSLFSNTKLESLEDLFCCQLEDLYDAETRLTKALPAMADAADSPELQTAFRQHLQQTEVHVSRLEQIFRLMNKDPERETCQAMKGLISEGEEMVKAQGAPDVKDAALIASAQRVEHYEIAGYGTARTFAQRLGMSEAAQLLQETLDEEGETDKRLTQIAVQGVNTRAMAASTGGKR
jgi:ferritin-like metal-binding protein YciE